MRSARVVPVVVAMLSPACVVAPARPAAPLPPLAPAPRAHHTTWSGRYLCAQGITALTLVLDTEQDGSTVAQFQFGPSADNPGVPRGSYTLRGTITMAAQGRFTLELTPEQWTDRPSGYEMVGLTATSDGQRNTLSGRIAAPSCSWVRLDRQR